MQDLNPFQHHVATRGDLNVEIWKSHQVDPDVLLKYLSEGKGQTVVYDGLDCKSCDNVSANEKESTSSTCALIALNCARMIFGLDKEGVWLPTDLREQRLLSNIVNRETLESVFSVSGPLRGYCQLDITELLKVPLFKDAFAISAFSSEIIPYPGSATVEGITSMLKSETFNVEPAIAAVIAYHARSRDGHQRCNNIICMRVQNTRHYRYIVFHQLPRAGDHLPTSVTFLPSDEGTARYIAALLQQIEVDSFDAYILTVGEPSSLFFNADILNQTVSILSRSAKLVPSVIKVAETLDLSTGYSNNSAQHPDIVPPSFDFPDPTPPPSYTAEYILPNISNTEDTVLEYDGTARQLVDISSPSSTVSSPLSSPSTPSAKFGKRAQLGWQLSLQTNAAIASSQQAREQRSEVQDSLTLPQEVDATLHSPSHSQESLPKQDILDIQQPTVRNRRAARRTTGQDISWLLPLQEVTISPRTEANSKFSTMMDGKDPNEEFSPDRSVQQNDVGTFLSSFVSQPRIYNNGQLELLFSKSPSVKSATSTSAKIIPLSLKTESSIPSHSSNPEVSSSEVVECISHQEESLQPKAMASSVAHAALEDQGQVPMTPSTTLSPETESKVSLVETSPSSPEILLPEAHPFASRQQEPKASEEINTSGEDVAPIDENVQLEGKEQKEPLPQHYNDLALPAAVEDSFDIIGTEDPTVSNNNVEAETTVLDEDWLLPQSQPTINQVTHGSPASEVADLDWTLPELQDILAIATVIETGTETETAIASHSEKPEIETDWLFPQSSQESDHSEPVTSIQLPAEIETSPSIKSAKLISKASFEDGKPLQSEYIASESSVVPKSSVEKKHEQTSMLESSPFQLAEKAQKGDQLKIPAQSTSDDDNVSGKYDSISKDSDAEAPTLLTKTVPSSHKKLSASGRAHSGKYQDFKWQLDLMATSMQTPRATGKSPSSSRSSETHSANSKRQNHWSPLQLRPELEHKNEINHAKTPRNDEHDKETFVEGSSSAATSRPKRRKPEINHSPTRSARQYRAVRDDYAWQLALVSKSLAPSENYLKERHERQERSARHDTSQWLTALAAQRLDGVGQDSFQEMSPIETSFECEVCFEIVEYNDAARMPNCEHSFCRECLQGHIQSKLEENTYPILCPICSMDKDRTTPGYVDQTLIDQLDLSEQSLDKFEELQMAAHSIQLECPECQETMMIARDDYLAQPIITCPLPGCRRRFCRACRLTINRVSDEHTCKVDEELDELMKANGWRYCPGCKTPIQKESGCNHMTCKSPGCTTHFCYTCGDSVWNSRSLQPLSTLLSEHYRNCNQFDPPPRRGQPAGARPVVAAGRRNRDCTIQ